MYSFGVMRRVSLAVLTVALAGLAFSPARASSESVSIKSGSGNEFHPETIRITIGDTVMWSNDDRTLIQTGNTRHSATADDGSFDSGRLKEGESFSFTFTKAGYFPYSCTVHPGMTGAVVVTAPQPTHRPTPTPTPTAKASAKPRPSKSATPRASATVSTPSATPTIDAAGVGSNGEASGKIIAVAIAAVTILLLLGYFVYVRFLREDY